MIHATLTYLRITEENTRRKHSKSSKSLNDVNRDQSRNNLVKI